MKNLIRSINLKESFLFKMELSHFRHNSSASIIERVGGNCSPLVSTVFFYSLKTSFITITGDHVTNSKPTKIQFCVI